MSCSSCQDASDNELVRVPSNLPSLKVGSSLTVEGAGLDSQVTSGRTRSSSQPRSWRSKSPKL
eukprot:756081-Rhodomonas_salina.3